MPKLKDMQTSSYTPNYVFSTGGGGDESRCSVTLRSLTLLGDSGENIIAKSCVGCCGVDGIESASPRTGDSRISVYVYIRIGCEVVGDDDGTDEIVDNRGVTGTIEMGIFNPRPAAEDRVSLANV
jgi:hypothetical protein